MRFLFIYLPYLSFAIFLIGVLYRFAVWGKTPVPLRIVTTPAPRTRAGVVWRLIGDALWFPSLWKSDKALWAGGFLFHIFFWLVLFRHVRYFVYPVPAWVAGIQTLGLYAGYLIPIPLAFLLIRRLVSERVFYISIPGDYVVLLLLLFITGTGVLLQVAYRTYIVDVKAIVLGILHLQPPILEVPWVFVLHFLSVMVLLVYFPFSKLMHSGGLFFSPTRNQRAKFAERFVNPWDFPVAYNALNLSSPEKYREELAGSPEGGKS